MRLGELNAVRSGKCSVSRILSQTPAGSVQLHNSLNLLITRSHHQAGIRESAFRLGPEIWISQLPVGEHALPFQFALRSLKIVVKTNDKSQLTSRLPPEQPMRTPRAAERL